MTVAGAIEAVKAISDDLVILPENPEYDNIIKSYFTELERELKPGCFLVPNSAEQVADILKAIKPVADDVKLAICGSGQQATPGVANVHDGITIHLKNIRGIDVNVEKKVVSIAAGEQVGEVYRKLVPLGLAVAGNRHSTGGIGGDAVQGGLSYFSYARGFVCDEVINYEVVLASGEIVNANAETHKDLWVALKGGGNNFGIVTRFDLRVFEQGTMWGGKVFYFEPSFPSQIQSLVDYLEDPNPETDIHICLSMGYAAAMGSILCMNDVFCARPVKPTSLEPFADIQPQIDSMRSLRPESLDKLTDEEFAGAPSNRVAKMTTTVKADREILQFAVEQYHVAFGKLKYVTNLLFSITFEPIPTSMIENGLARGENSLGLKASDGPLVVILFYSSWDSSEDDEKIYNASKEALETISNEALRKGLSTPWLYMNYAFPGQDPISGFGPESKAHLQAVSAKYDPYAFFQVVGSGPFKL